MASPTSGGGGEVVAMWRRLLLALFLLASSGAKVSGVSGYCSTHRFAQAADATSNNVMQFTKEVVSMEYTTLRDEYKSLHCCARGYQSIEWFKNGKPSPWSRDISSLIVDPKAENQTIYTRTISYNDAGNYTCVMRNATHKREHHIELIVFADSPDTPLPTFRPHDITVGLEQPARLFCEAYVGHVKLPDAQSVVTWSQSFDGELTPVGDGAQINVNREVNQTVGAYLLIARMQSFNYGRYVCRIDIGNAANRLEMSVQISGPPTEATDLYWSMTALQLALFAALLTLGLLVVVRYSLTWYTLWRKREANHCLARNNNRNSGGLLAGQQQTGDSGGSLAAGSGTNAEKLMHFRNVV